ncbi:hypothetical protein [Streptomyces diastatochromogenes]|uniref:Uncharacterized protein n=1 Tax=Streptomyces diastatochromogenes TaxID=42236 RepID=A0A233RWA6_STRDA|nr:hypothetical protein [Streptomyces diastatochromogenes]MCZ0991843.1 hypothetical protein [Streptomyces diastatochromogenes]OXY87643.1 hypothetical protein BEK98_43475 [Streptomyces diastatochromogenes]
MTTAQTPDFDDPDLREKIREALGSEAGQRRFDQFLRTPVDLRRNQERLGRLLLGTLVLLVLMVIVLAILALCAVETEPDAADVYGTLALVASGGVVGVFVLLRMHRARMRRGGRRSA